jgi:galactose mutarotase-like enzyme
VHEIHERDIEGFPAVELAAPDADLRVTVVPDLAMLVPSLRHRGEELLGQRSGVGAYAARGATMGIPLLHPWANRLSGFRYAAAGRAVTLDPRSPLLSVEEHGLPIHGLRLAGAGWDVLEAVAGTDGALVAGRLDLGARGDILAAFPYPHELRVTVRLSGPVLGVVTEVRPTGDGPVPIAFGFHPYFDLPGAPRAEWVLGLPVRRHATLDARGLPTGVVTDVEVAEAPIGGRTYDDLFPGLDDPAVFTLEGAGRRLELRFGEGYPVAQVFAPPGADVVALEPMTAPTDALVSGDGLRLARPGEPFRAEFSLAVAV